MKKIFCFLCFIALGYSVISQQKDSKNEMIDSNTIITDDNVNVREYPSTKDKIVKVLSKNEKVVIRGISAKPETIDGITSYWLRISQSENTREIGWVFGKYILNGSKVKPCTPSVFSSLDVSEAMGTWRKEVVIIFYVGDKQIIEKVEAHYDEQNNQYTFNYDSSYEKYDWHCTPGTYIINPKTREIKHISYIFYSDEYSVVVFSRDFKYLYAINGNSGYSGLIKELHVWDLGKNVVIFKGNYYARYGDNELRDEKNDHILHIAYKYDAYNWSHNGGESELNQYVQKYKEENNVFGENEANKIVVICTYNIDMMKRKFLEIQKYQEE